MAHVFDATNGGEDRYIKMSERRSGQNITEQRSIVDSEKLLEPLSSGSGKLKHSWPKREREREEESGTEDTGITRSTFQTQASLVMCVCVCQEPVSE